LRGARETSSSLALSGGRNRAIALTIVAQQATLGQ
jgi:hypothetical protein